MQTTLLGIAIVFILALIAALVGPFFIDWNQYRHEFETQASRLTGLEVRITGPIEARLLPTPALTLQGIELARPGDAGSVRARSLDVEFALGALMRGDWRANQARLEGPEVTVGLDKTGRLEWPLRSIAMNLDAVSIEQIEVNDGRVTLADAASGSRIVLDKLEFRGELRSLAGPVKGDGAFVVAGQHYPYRVAASRIGDDGKVRVHLNVDPIDRPLVADVDTFLFIERGILRFDGNVKLARPVGRTPDGIDQPWRVASRIKGDSKSAVLDQIELQYGPDDHAVRLRGGANLALGNAPQLEIDLHTTQIDLDRMLALPEPARQQPIVVVKALANFLTGVHRLPIPVRLGIGVDNAILAGTALSRLSGEFQADADSWQVKTLEFRAPGATQVRLNGRLDLGSSGVVFSGPAEVQTRDSRALIGWLTGRTDAQVLSTGPLRVQGDIKIDNETIAIEALKADLDQMAVEGRLAYSRASGGKPARMEATVNAPELNLDHVYALAQGLFGENSLEWPREGAISVKAGRALVQGLEARSADIAAQFTQTGIEIERLAVGDLGGAALSAKGRLDLSRSSPRGTIALALDARALDGVAALVDKIAPVAATELRSRMAQFVPAKVRATLSIDPDPSQPAGSSLGSLKLEGSAGGFRISLQGHAGGRAGDLTTANLERLGDTTTAVITGTLEAGDGSALVALLGLDPWIAVDKRPAQLKFSSKGTFAGALVIEGHLAAAGLDLAAKGTGRLAGENAPRADLDVKVTSAHFRSPRPGSTATTLPAAFTGRVALARGNAVVSDLAGEVAGADIAGGLKIGFAQPVSVEGDIELGEVNLPAVIAAVTGVPLQGGAGGPAWPAQPFEHGLLGSLAGRIAVRAEHVSLTPMLAAKQVHALVRFDRSTLRLEDLDGMLAGGRIAGDMTFTRGSDGITVRTRLKSAGADLAELIRGGPPPLSGRLTFDVDVQGSGRSPVAVIGSLSGGGTFKVHEANILHLDPAAFEAVIRGADQGLPIDAGRVRDRTELALGNGSAAIPLAEGVFAIASGQARINSLVLPMQGGELAIDGSVALADEVIDAKVMLSGPERADAPRGMRPQVGITLKGPLATAKRSLDAAEFANWLALRAIEQQAKRLDAVESPGNVPFPTAPQTSTATTAPPPPEPPSEAPSSAVPRRIVRTPARPRPLTQPALPGQAPLDIRPPGRSPRIDSSGAPPSARVRREPAGGSDYRLGNSVEP